MKYEGFCKRIDEWLRREQDIEKRVKLLHDALEWAEVQGEGVGFTKDLQVMKRLLGDGPTAKAPLFEQLDVASDEEKFRIVMDGVPFGPAFRKIEDAEVIIPWLFGYLQTTQPDRLFEQAPKPESQS